MPMYYGYGPFGFFWGFFGWIIGIIIIILIIRLLIGHPRHWRRWYQDGKSAIDILKERYAKGEITKEQFDAMRKDIGE